MQQYKYLGDRLTDPALKGQLCHAIRRVDGKCIRGKNGSMLVQFESGHKANVIGRMLRKVHPVLIARYDGALKAIIIDSCN